MELLIVVAIVGLLGALMLGAAGGCTRSQGERVGVVSKISEKGVIFKSFEGELMLGRGESANTWQFSVKDTKVVTEVREAMRSGKRVELEYKQQFLPPIVRSTPYTVIKVTTLE